MPNKQTCSALLLIQILPDLKVQLRLHLSAKAFFDASDHRVLSSLTPPVQREVRSYVHKVRSKSTWKQNHLLAGQPWAK